MIKIIYPGQYFGDLSEKATDYLQAGIDSHSKSITVLYPDVPPQNKRVNDSLQDNLLPGLELTVKHFFLRARLIELT